jgi:hypothetical protein
MKIKVIELSLSNVTNSDSRDTDTYVRNAHPVEISSFTTIISTPDTIGKTKLSTGITPVINILNRHSAEIIPPRATL